MGSKQRTYTPEFREGAVRIVIETGRPTPEVAEKLGVHSGTLHSWVSRWRRNGSASSDRPRLPPRAVGCGILRGHEVSGQAPNRVVLNKETRKKWRHPVSVFSVASPG
ncbi:transposase [Streptomyces mirabilis]|uniref:transposase n=1 Tax=Streptomyces mirabilis TaxID=68239 RepID=UPI0036797EC9